MSLKSKVVLHWVSGDETLLDEFVEQCIREKVKFVGVVGQNCSRIEDIIDDLVVGDGGDGTRFILTSSHPNETVDEAVEFARSLTLEFSGDVQVIEL